MKRIFCLLSAVVLFFTVSGCTADVPKDILKNKTVTAKYSDHYASITMELPVDWEYAVIDEILMTDDPGDIERAGIEFWPKNQPDARMGLYYYVDSYGICGTGPTRENLTFTSGHEAILYWEELEELSYAYVFYKDTPGEYLFEAHYIPTEFWRTERETILSILDTAIVGGDALSENEALAIAEAECEKFYPHSYREFDHRTGQWTFRFYVVGNLIKQTVVVNPDGTVEP